MSQTEARPVPHHMVWQDKSPEAVDSSLPEEHSYSVPSEPVAIADPKHLMNNSPLTENEFCNEQMPIGNLLQDSSNDEPRNTTPGLPNSIEKEVPEENPPLRRSERVRTARKFYDASSGK